MITPILKRVLIGYFLFPASLVATEVSLSVVDGHVIANFNQIDYPVKLLKQELKSGLPNTIDVVIKIKRDSEVFFQEAYRFNMIYDLWEEMFFVTRTVRSGVIRKQFKNDDVLLDYLSNLNKVKLLLTDNAMRAKKLTVSFQIFFNPVQSERIKKIQQWMKSSYVDSNKVKTGQFTARKQSPRNITRRSREHSESSVTGIVGSGPRFQKLFDKILEQHVSEGSMAAQWKSEPVLKEFSVKSIVNENR